MLVRDDGLGPNELFLQEVLQRRAHGPELDDVVRERGGHFRHPELAIAGHHLLHGGVEGGIVRVQDVEVGAEFPQGGKQLDQEEPHEHACLFLGRPTGLVARDALHGLILVDLRHDGRRHRLHPRHERTNVEVGVRIAQNHRATETGQDVSSGRQKLDLDGLLDVGGAQTALAGIGQDLELELETDGQRDLAIALMDEHVSN